MDTVERLIQVQAELTADQRSFDIALDALNQTIHVEDNERIEDLFSSLMEDIDKKLELNKSMLSKIIL